MAGHDIVIVPFIKPNKTTSELNKSVGELTIGLYVPILQRMTLFVKLAVNVV